MTIEYKKQSANKGLLHWLAVASLLIVPFSLQAQEGDEDKSWDGLVSIEDSNIAGLFINPEADFSAFRQVGILEPQVAFRSNWQRDQNRSRSRNVRASDMERIKSDVADIFITVFTEQLEAAGYAVVNYVDEDVLLLRPAIVDLDVTAPDVSRAGRTRTYAANAGAATLFIEMFDAPTGDLLGRAVDRRTAGRNSSFAIQSNRVTNRADARREFRRWADMLIEFLDQHYVSADAAAE